MREKEKKLSQMANTHPQRVDPRIVEGVLSFSISNSSGPESVDAVVIKVAAWRARVGLNGCDSQHAVLGPTGLAGMGAGANPDCCGGYHQYRAHASPVPHSSQAFSK